MARRLIGLDVGTNAVRVAELELSDPPRLTSFGQVALPPGAMRDGEVVDPAAVTAAIERLWKELSLKKAPVRVGVASPRVLVRTVDLPTMSDDELAGALQFQAQDLIPIPLEDAVLDFQVLESLPTPEVVGDGPAPQPMSRVLLRPPTRTSSSTSPAPSAPPGSRWPRWTSCRWRWCARSVGGCRTTGPASRPS